jgi:hypothetical protein
MSIGCITREKKRGREGVLHQGQGLPAAETEVVALGGIGARAWGTCVRVRKGGDEGDARLIY